jgi:hypothetical protein
MSDDVSDSTKAAEKEDAEAKHVADRGPTPDEEAAADTDVLDEGVAEHYEDMAKRGVEQQGEGRID